MHKQEISEASKRAQQNVALNVNLQQEYEDLNITVEDITVIKKQISRCELNKVREKQVSLFTRTD